WLEHAHDWVVTVDHKRLGILYVVSGLVFFVVAGIEATLMRLQLAWPGLHIVPPETFNRLFTMHGTSMVFLVGIPIVFGFGNYLVPLMIGARDLAFPRLNAFGFWIFLFAGLLLHWIFIGGAALSGSGMTLGRMPIFVWTMVTVSAMTLFILPPLSAAQIMLLLDRFLGAHFFDTQAGGSAVMWQHFFWFFGHPEVYVLMLPGFGFVSEI